MKCRFAVLLLTFLLCLSTRGLATPGIVYGLSSGNAIQRVNPQNGASALIATGQLDVIFSYDKFVVDLAAQKAYQFGQKSSVNSLETIDLSSGTTSVVTLNLSNPIFGGIYDGTLIAAIGNEIRSVDPGTGNSTVIAMGELDTVLSYDKFIVDAANATAYQYGIKNGVNSLEKIDLESGAVTILSTNLSGNPAFGGFYEGNLIAAQNNQIMAVNSVTGVATLLATGTLDTVLSGDKFVVDNGTGLAYQYGIENGVNSLETINLETNTSTFVSFSPSSSPIFSAVPEPSSLALGLLTIVLLILFHKKPCDI